MNGFTLANFSFGVTDMLSLFRVGAGDSKPCLICIEHKLAVRGTAGDIDFRMFLNLDNGRILRLRGGGSLQVGGASDLASASAIAATSASNFPLL